MQSFVEVKERLIKFNNEYKRLCEMLGFEEVFLDKKLYIKLEKEMQELKPIATKYEEYLSVKNNLQEYQELVLTLNEEKELCLNEIKTMELNKVKLEEELVRLIINFNAVIQKIIVEVVNKSSDKLFNDIICGYKKFSENNNFEVVEDISNDNVKLHIIGKNVKEYFDKESGCHTLRDGSNVIVIVYDGYDNSEMEFNEDDVKIETCRSSGAGGQHVNTTDSAIKATHLPTGITATCQDERSQLQNKQKAIENLKVKVEEYFKGLESEFLNKQKSQVLKKTQNKLVVKTYNYDENIIIKNDKTNIEMSEFLKGNII